VLTFRDQSRSILRAGRRGGRARRRRQCGSSEFRGLGDARSCTYPHEVVADLRAEPSADRERKVQAVDLTTKRFWQYQTSLRSNKFRVIAGTSTAWIPPCGRSTCSQVHAASACRRTAVTNAGDRPQRRSLEYVPQSSPAGRVASEHSESREAWQARSACCQQFRALTSAEDYASAEDLGLLRRSCDWTCRPPAPR
jgi:hypothetical protein